MTRRAASALALACAVAGIAGAAAAQPTSGDGSGSGSGSGSGIEPEPEPEPAAPPTPAPEPPETSVPQVTPSPAPTVPKPSEPGPTPIADELPGVTTGAWRARRHFDLHWHILMVPEQIVELVFTPVRILVEASERYRLDRRLGDLLDPWDQRLVLAPRFKFSFGDGLGAGLWAKHPGIVSESDFIRVGGIVRLNLDWQLELQYRHALLLPGGRGLRAHAFLEQDKNQRYYGIGGATAVADKRVLRSDDQGATLEFDLQAIDRYTYSGIMQLGYRRQTLSPGEDAMEVPVGGMGDTVIPPPGFDRTAHFVDVSVAGRYDTRDTSGRPMRGVFGSLGAHARADVSGDKLSALTLDGKVSVFLPVIGDHRTVLLSFGTTVALPIFRGSAIPLDSLALIGRNNVRGYDRERFRDKYGFVTTAEYRFPLHEYLNSRAGLDAFFFADAGEVWGRTPLTLDNIRYSFGGGLRGAHETRLGFETTFGWSPEGVQLNLGVETAL